MTESSTFVTTARHRESQAVELRHGERKEWTREGERTRGISASVAIDGNRTRKKAARMIVRRKRTEKSQFGWHRGMRNYRPDARIYSVLRDFFFTRRQNYEQKTGIPMVKESFSRQLYPPFHLTKIRQTRRTIL